MGPITDHTGARVTCMGLGNAYTHPLGYVTVQVQVDGVQGYDEDQVALVIPDESKFVRMGPHYFGNPHYKQCISECHKGEGNRCFGNALGKCQGDAHLLSVCRAVASLLEDQTSEGANPNWVQWSGLHEKHRDYRSFFLLGDIHKSGKSLNRGTHLMSWPKHCRLKDWCPTPRS